MPLNKFIQAINEQIKGIFPDSKLFGIAQPLTRTKGAVTEIIPAIVDHSGEAVYPGIDDVYSVQVYHKQNRISIARKQEQGYGDNFSDIVNAYQLSMIIFHDRTKVKMMPDELVLHLQANIAEKIGGIKPYKRVLVRLNTIILNPEQVFSQEYRNVQFRLPVEKSLIQVDYTIESTFKQGCFEKCPEGLTCNHD